MDKTIKIADMVNFLAIFIGPFLAVWASIYIQEKRELKNRRFALFTTFVSNRHWIFNEELTKAYNSIDVLFHDDKEVRKQWKELLALFRTMSAALLKFAS